jgi:hypothetical protein
LPTIPASWPSSLRKETALSKRCSAEPQRPSRP